MAAEFKVLSLNLIQRRSFLMEKGFNDSNGELVKREGDNKVLASPYPFKVLYVRDRYGKPIETHTTVQGHDQKVLHPITTVMWL